MRCRMCSASDCMSIFDSGLFARFGSPFRTMLYFPSMGMPSRICAAHARSGYAFGTDQQSQQSIAWCGVADQMTLAFCGPIALICIIRLLKYMLFTFFKCERGESKVRLSAWFCVVSALLCLSTHPALHYPALHYATL